MQIAALISVSYLLLPTNCHGILMNVLIQPVDYHNFGRILGRYPLSSKTRRASMPIRGNMAA